jgi:hypothetical protein
MPNMYQAVAAASKAASQMAANRRSCRTRMTNASAVLFYRFCRHLSHRKQESQVFMYNAQVKINQDRLLKPNEYTAEYPTQSSPKTEEQEKSERRTEQETGT